MGVSPSFTPSALLQVRTILGQKGPGATCEYVCTLAGFSDAF